MSAVPNEAPTRSQPAIAAAALREEIDRLVESDPAAAAEMVREWWAAQPTPAVAPAAVAAFERLRDRVPFTRCRLAILRSFTVEPMLPLLRAMAFAAGIDLDILVTDFGTYTQDILDPGSRLYAFEANVVILAVQSRDLSPPLWESFASLSEAEVSAAVGNASSSMTGLLEAFRSRSSAALVVHTLQLPPSPANGVFDAQAAFGQREAFARINREIAAAARGHDHVYLLDYEALVARHGSEAWHDERLWAVSRLPIRPANLVHLAREWMRFLHPLTGRVAKVLAVDLDNTLWGGVIGEDGMDGIKVGRDLGGLPFLNLQRAILDLHARGVVLAICSKNNTADAMEALQKHPGMLLRPSHFAAHRTNWQDKATNLREIAAELNLGIDSVAFIDDNPVERTWVRKQAPEVFVLDLPTDPGRYASALRDWPIFERLRLTEEDRNRASFYAQDRERGELQSSAKSLEEFLQQLQIRISIDRMTPQTLPRIAQLTQKTNQFNLTTRRYSEGEMAAMASDPGVRIYALSASDRFGENGLVGVAILRLAPAAWTIDTLLMSCRVIGRTIETALIAHIAADARAAGASTLLGEFIPTKKNAPAKDFFATHGFAGVGEAGAGGAQRWELPLSSDPPLAPPRWVEVRVNR